MELRTAATRVIIDVGMPLVDKNGQSFDTDSLEGKGTAQLLEEGVLPSVPGLFGDGLVPDAIPLSHAHCDHTGLLKYTNPQIPVWMSPGTSDMMYVAFKFARQHGVTRARQHTFTPQKPFQIGDFRVTAFPVDHSAFDSMAFLIEADGKRLLYSGDLRLHGRKPGMAKRLLEAISPPGVDVLLMEGTHLGATPRPRVTEYDLENVIVGHIAHAPGIVLAVFSPLHVDRLVTFFKAARRVGRRFVADVHAALVMQRAAQYFQGIPNPVIDRSIRVFYPHTFLAGYQRKNLGSVFQMFAANRIEMDELRVDPRQWVMVFRPSMLETDFPQGLPQSPCCIYSLWAGYLDRPYGRMLPTAVKTAGGTFIEAHTSGHVQLEEIAAFVSAVNPGVVIPLHTFAPDALRELCDRVLVLNDNQAWDVARTGMSPGSPG